MDETRAQAYANLIQQLLSCPNGEQSQILQDNSELLDAEFLQLCEVIADNLAGEGQENAADFLRNLASQLGQFLGMNQGSNSDDLEFLMQLLQTVSDSQGNPQQVYPFLQQNLDRLDLQLIKILTAWAKDIFAKVEATQAYNIAAVIFTLGNLIQQFPLGSRLVNLEIAIACYQRALQVYTPEDFPQDWAMTQNNLGSAYKNKITGNRAENIDEAIACYQRALQVYTPEDFPQDWAMTQNNLGNAYWSKITGNRAENIDEAIACYQRALQVRTREDFPFNNVETLNNLGWAYRAKLDYINSEKPEDTQQKTATLQSAYDTFKDAITGADSLRQLIKSSDEIKQKHDVEWDKLYKGMVSVCLDRNSNQEALIYAETNKARNLAELIAQKQETPKTLEPISFGEISQLLTTDTALIEWYITDEEIITFVLSTALVMVKFYEELQPGVSIGQALYDTQLWFKSAYPSDLKKWVRGSRSFTKLTG
jgi:tetratricopeptide (TPR) repeat protein